MSEPTDQPPNAGRREFGRGLLRSLIGNGGSSSEPGNTDGDESSWLRLLMERATHPSRRTVLKVAAAAAGGIDKLPLPAADAAAQLLTPQTARAMLIASSSKIAAYTDGVARQFGAQIIHCLSAHNPNVTENDVAKFIMKNVVYTANPSERLESGTATYGPRYRSLMQQILEMPARRDYVDTLRRISTILRDCLHSPGYGYSGLARLADTAVERFDPALYVWKQYQAGAYNDKLKELDKEAKERGEPEPKARRTQGRAAKPERYLSDDTRRAFEAMDKHGGPKEWRKESTRRRAEKEGWEKE